jgi:hypothetical protein
VLLIHRYAHKTEVVMKIRLSVYAAIFGAALLLVTGITTEGNASTRYRDVRVVHYGAPPKLGIPRGHLPPVGSYRIWIPGRPAGLQPAALYRSDAVRFAPPGAWVIYRPAHDSRFVYVRVMDMRRHGILSVVHVYDARRGTYVRSEVPVRVRHRW